MIARLEGPVEGATELRVEFLDAGDSQDRDAWVSLWNSWPRREIMAHPDYVRLFARPEDRVVAAVVRRAGGGILYPVIVRPLEGEPWAPPGGRALDVVTPYGYGGPFGWNVEERETRTFWDRFDEWARSQGVITSFSRLSLFPDQLIPFNGETEVLAPNVVCRVDRSEQEILADYLPKTRQNVNHARNLGLQVETDLTGARMDEFLDIYVATMKRRGASGGYFFPRAFFESIVRDLAGHFCFFHLILKERAISSDLVLLSQDSSYCFLAGALEEAFTLRANDLLKHEIILWSRTAGKSAVVLGGGYRGEKDGVYRYKKSFAQHGDVPFKVAKKIYDAPRAESLMEDRRRYERAQGNEWQPEPRYFPAYRA